MPDLDTCRMPRDTLLGLIHSTSKHERITAPIPIPTLTELLGHEAALEVPPEPQVVVRFTPPQPVVAVAAPATGVHIVARSHWVVAISAAATLLVGVAVIFFA